VDDELGGVRSGDDVGRPDEIEEVLLGKPLVPGDDLLSHEREMRGRTTEPDDSELPEQPGEAYTIAAVISTGEWPVYAANGGFIRLFASPATRQRAVSSQTLSSAAQIA
jgi:hypothetical protein